MSLKAKRYTITAALVIIFLLLACGLTFKSVIDKPLKINSDEKVVIENGESFYTFLDSLKEKKQIKSTLFIKLYAKLSGINLDIIPGEYVLKKDLSTKDIIQLLKSTPEDSYVNFTIPEGFTIDDISEKLEKENICTAEEFIAAVNEYPLPAYVKKSDAKRYSLEGFLFPDTYKFEKNIEPSEIVNILVNRFDEVWNEIVNGLKVNVSDDEIEKIITVASMVEKEARIDDERATIASVIYNRINEDMTLSIDATVLYAYGYHKEKLYYKDLEIDSPYNTYMYKGLPAGPISNPGIQSIIAALMPEDTNYLFYVLEDDNRHYFTDNDEDFMKKQEELGY